MGENNTQKPDLMVPLPLSLRLRRTIYEPDGKPPQIKLTLDAEEKEIANPITQVQPIFNQGTIELYFKWIKSLNSILAGQLITEHYHLALNSL
jgi:hypothetical protein